MPKKHKFYSRNDGSRFTSVPIPPDRESFLEGVRVGISAVADMCRKASKDEGFDESDAWRGKSPSQTLAYFGEMLAKIPITVVDGLPPDKGP